MYTYPGILKEILDKGVILAIRFLISTEPSLYFHKIILDSYRKKKI